MSYPPHYQALPDLPVPLSNGMSWGIDGKMVNTEHLCALLDRVRALDRTSIAPNTTELRRIEACVGKYPKHLNAYMLGVNLCNFADILLSYSLVPEAYYYYYTAVKLAGSGKGRRCMKDDYLLCDAVRQIAKMMLVRVPKCCPFAVDQDGYSWKPIMIWVRDNFDDAEAASYLAGVPGEEER